MPLMLLPIFPDEATTINPLLGFCREEDMVHGPGFSALPRGPYSEIVTGFFRIGTH
jgi:hypothetical protein